MKKTVLPLFSLAVLLALPASLASGGADEVFRKADKNGDGKVTRDELTNQEMFAAFDTNKDGVITIEEARPVLAAMAAEKATAADNPQNGTAPAGPNSNGKPRLAGLFQRLRDRRGQSPAAESAGAQPAPAIQGPLLSKPGDLGVGRQVADLAFTTLDGKSHKLSDWKSGLAIAFTSTTCPVSKRYAPSLARLEQELAARNVALLLVNPFASETEAAAQIKAQALAARYVHDTSKALAQALEARTTTEVFLLDPKRTLVYRGALDDQYGVAHNLDAPRERYLLDAVNAMLAGKHPTVAATEAPGCELDLAAPAAAARTPATYHRDVARILQQNCVRCHHDKGIAPFPLDNLAEVRDRAKTIRRVIEDRTMPPWFAAPVPAGQPNPWANDHSLSARDKADLLAWIGSADRPLGNPEDAPVPLKFTEEWSIGKPDLIVQLKRPYAIKAEGFMPYQTALVETTLKENRWVQAYEIMPTAREVVHHVIVHVHEKGARIQRGGEEGDLGYWAVYVPGNTSRVYPEGFARKLPAGATVSFQIHYTPSGKATQDQLRMGLIFAKEPPRYAMHTAAVAGRRLNIPPGAANHVETATKTVPFDMNVTAFMAHMHVRGKAFRFEITTPDGKSETLLDIPRYDFNWQLPYEYKQPRTFPRGSTMKITATYDNSAGNKANPDPTKTVRWGQQTVDEMMLGYIEYFTPMPGAKAQAATVR